MATLRNFAIGLLRLFGFTNVARTSRCFAASSRELLHYLRLEARVSRTARPIGVAPPRRPAPCARLLRPRGRCGERTAFDPPLAFIPPPQARAPAPAMRSGVTVWQALP